MLEKSPGFVTRTSPYRGINNRLLRALPAETLDRILQLAEPISLVRGQRIDCADQPIRYLHFINRGMVCLAKATEDGRTVEVAAIGIEGVANILPLVDVGKAILDVVVQIPGTALRIRNEAMKGELERDETLHRLMQRYVSFGLSELARHIACNRLHHISQRCCRWLLIAHDNSLSDDFPVTHEFLAMMLGYQRAGVSMAMGVLVKDGLIEHRRGMVTVVDRQGLEHRACGCYREMQGELDEFLPHFTTTEIAGAGRTRSSLKA